ncbi:MAG: FKBP-type peptidyl-prolyl cis-trans isomerase [Methanoregula sp.]|nr:FKBP-type peptidyl-prolyl cis-trans isomerase [Methanoregula sp.]
MKKSEKQKGKEKVTARRQQYKIAGIVVAIILVVAIIAVFVWANPFVAKKGDTVSVYFTGSLENGTVFYSNMNGTPLEFILGSGQSLADFDSAVTGMWVNQEKTVNITADRAYGAYNPDLIMVLNRSVFPTNVSLVRGAMYSITRTSDNANGYVRLVNYTDTTVTVDGNHELAGQNLTFTIKLASIDRA